MTVPLASAGSTLVCPRRCPPPHDVIPDLPRDDQSAWCVPIAQMRTLVLHYDLTRCFPWFGCKNLHPGSPLLLHFIQVLQFTWLPSFPELVRVTLGSSSPLLHREAGHTGFDRAPDVSFSGTQKTGTLGVRSAESGCFSSAPSWEKQGSRVPGRLGLCRSCEFFPYSALHLWNGDCTCSHQPSTSYPLSTHCLHTCAEAPPAN